ncbi:hypothetical protein AB6A40_004251 [Gnathostoma spinigerum]|uniref:MYND-type domain-containing protein n=1 Tax=Gnathostoma spinigerum TaxID=75299 RepID=A0ABD6ELU7_9BILA
MANKSEISLTNKECLNSEVYEIEGKPRVNFYPFAYALNNNCLSDHCWYCLDSNDHLRRCTGCLSAVFCDKNCQSLGWKDHRAECKPLSCCDSIPDIEVRLLGRIVVRYKTIKRGKDKLDENFYYMRSSKREIMEVWCHSEILRNDLSAMKKFDDIYTRMVDFLGSKVLLSKDDVFELHCRDFINRHAISDKGYVQEIGKGLYLDLCAYDHSCSPNSIYTFNGFIATLRGLTTDVCLLDRSSTFYSYIDPLKYTDSSHYSYLMISNLSVGTK